MGLKFPEKHNFCQNIWKCFKNQENKLFERYFSSACGQYSSQIIKIDMLYW